MRCQGIEGCTNEADYPLEVQVGGMDRSRRFMEPQTLTIPICSECVTRLAGRSLNVGPEDRLSIPVSVSEV